MADRVEPHKGNLPPKMESLVRELEMEGFILDAGLAFGGPLLYKPPKDMKKELEKLRHETPPFNLFCVLLYDAISLYGIIIDPQHRFTTGDELRRCTIIACVTAFEVYCEDVVRQYGSSVSQTDEDKSKRLNFQDLKFCKKVFKEEFGIDIVKINEKIWTDFTKYVDHRHELVHKPHYRMLSIGWRPSPQGLRNCILTVFKVIKNINSEVMKSHGPGGRPS